MVDVRPGFSQELEDKNVLVLGYGVSGQSAESFLVSRGANVYVYDEKDIKTKVAPVLHGLPDDLQIDLCVTSPGFSINHPIIRELTTNHVPVVGELELSFDASRWNYWIAVTGTNGKTTTTSLIGHLLKKAGHQVVIGGNIGVPITSFLTQPISETIIVAEVSSFQLETVYTFRPQVAAFLNLTPDHLDRHGTMENYFNTKARIFAMQQEQDRAVLNAEDRWTRSLLGTLKSQTVTFGIEKGDVHWENGMLLIDGKAVASLDNVKLKGTHNLANISAAVACCHHILPENFDYASAISSFLAPEHRIEFVRSVNGVDFYDDSKATNIDSTVVALEAFSEPVILILGGRNKGMDFTPLADFIKNESSVKWIVLMGESKDSLRDALIKKGIDSFSEADSLEKAVEEAFDVANEGDVVLLSPACASFDMFKNFEERGDKFKEIVKAL
ncbi:UDP-N-acetylmuramoyl-L-alanine--D-glutamate ligase [Coprothermobacter platensis]|uniref:UDP-N-acetylmuramoyl-L-alanine--D-glutamate ligase n=1 Tax=Coprothermobacter platensis TaxID=108819 RepID=UPI0003783DA0|nr:UDP-N-acetylmuramoyl-L-alanine--D-glutamate ligase [Coprothermobacter platensis]